MTLNHVLQMLKQQKKLVETYKNNLFKDLVQKPPTPNSLSITVYYPLFTACSISMTLSINLLYNQYFKHY
ncbi:hypothetical protein NHP190012_08290 [Helicobacter sp. NHP19-012]|uniref:Uncharacterized protein n=1 Tax=Helicobacter gastrofelis TaxID=2849642 RepID=A0ABN6I6J1_9HELI|nr:hypothetical protein NHP190012_08290 [Helicobacter sp. NHP19-012]